MPTFCTVCKTKISQGFLCPDCLKAQAEEVTQRNTRSDISSKYTPAPATSRYSTVPSDAFTLDATSYGVKIDDLVELASEAYDSKDYDLAQNYLNRALAMDPEHGRARFMKKKVEYRLEDQNPDLNVKTPPPRRADFNDIMKLARETYERGNLSSALGLVEDALNIEPTSGEARYLRRMINFKMGKDDTIQSSDNALYRCPNCNETFEISRRMKEASGGSLNCPSCLAKNRMHHLREVK